MILREREDTGILKGKQHIVLCGEFALEEAMDLTKEKGMNETQKHLRINTEATFIL